MNSREIKVPQHQQSQLVPPQGLETEQKATKNSQFHSYSLIHHSWGEWTEYINNHQL